MRHLFRRRLLCLLLFSFTLGYVTLNVALRRFTIPQNFSKSLKEDILLYVDPFIGTGGDGHTFPGPSAPFGKVQPSPDNGESGWNWTSGYHISSESIFGFSNTHLSGTGIPDLMDVTMMPLCLRHKEMEGRSLEEHMRHLLIVDSGLTVPELRELFAEKFDKAAFRNLMLSRISHACESAKVGYYSVQLQKHNILVELTASSDVGVHRYTLMNNTECDERVVVIDLSTSHFPTGISMSGQIHVAPPGKNNTSEVHGYRFSNGWAMHRKLFYHIEFSEPIMGHFILNNADEDYDWKGCSRSGCHIAFLKFDSFDGLLARIALSSVGAENARSTLDKSHALLGFDFDRVKESTESEWRKYLSKVTVHGGTAILKRTFYSALYHAMLAPIVHSDADGSYRGPDGSIRKASKHLYYSTLSIWDTFRAQFALLTILDREVSHDIAMTMISHAKSFDDRLPVWTLAGLETNTMPGYHAVCFLAESLNKGVISNKDADTILEVAHSTAQKQSRINARLQIDDYGYVPSDMSEESVSKTLEYAFDDWCIAEIARTAGNIEQESYYRNRSAFYKNIFDPETGFMRPKDSNGNFKPKFDPSYSQHVGGDFTEGTAWQYLWFVPHNIEDLVQLLGGKNKAEDTLDEFFFPSVASEIRGNQSSRDITGLIGHYAHGNEPGHHTAYLFNFLGSPHKTQYLTQLILRTKYSDAPDGIVGNDDCGQMSAWFVLSSIGIYPINPPSATYQITTPLFERTELRIPTTHGAPSKEDSLFVIDAPGAGSHPYMYIAEATLYGSHGSVLRTIFSKGTGNLSVSHQELVSGGRLHLKLVSSPMNPFSESVVVE